MEPTAGKIFAEWQGRNEIPPDETEFFSSSRNNDYSSFGYNLLVCSEDRSIVIGRVGSTPHYPIFFAARRFVTRGLANKTMDQAQKTCGSSLIC